MLDSYTTKLWGTSVLIVLCTLFISCGSDSGSVTGLKSRICRWLLNPNGNPCFKTNNTYD
jgi:hypothetical protein